MAKSRVLLLAGALAVAALVAVPLVSRAGGKKVLRWKFQPGQQFTRVLTQESAVTIRSPGSDPLTRSMQEVTDMHWRVDSVDDEGVAEMQQQVLRMQLSRAAQDMKIELDTNSPEEPAGPARVMDAMLKAVVKSPLQVTMDQQGLVRDVTVSNEAQQELMTIPGSEHMQDLVSTASLKRRIQEGSLVLPSDPLRKGMHWIQRITMPLELGQGVSVGELVVKSIYRYQGQEEVDGRPLERIDVDVDVSINQTDTAEGTSAKVVEQKCGGRIYFDSQSGYLASSEVAQSFTIELRRGDTVVTQQYDQSTRLLMSAE